MSKLRQDVEEPIGASETVFVILGKEGVEVKPADTRCNANIAEPLLDKNGDPKVDSDGVRKFNPEVRCDQPITFDMESESWAQMCSDHQAQTNKARQLGEVPPSKVSKELIEADLAALAEV